MSGLLFLVLGLALAAIGRWAARHAGSLVERGLDAEQGRRKEAAIRRGARGCSVLGAVFLVFAALHLIPA